MLDLMQNNLIIQAEGIRMRLIEKSDVKFVVYNAVENYSSYNGSLKFKMQAKVDIEIKSLFRISGSKLNAANWKSAKANKVDNFTELKMRDFIT